jgi:tripartite-type tricarboxylate transporter receptor subunit TctC
VCPHLARTMIPKKSHNQEIHMTQRLGRRAALAWVAGLGAALLPAHAQTFPTKAITIINPFAAGGPADLIARAAAKVLSENLG